MFMYRYIIIINEGYRSLMRRVGTPIFFLYIFRTNGTWEWPISQSNMVNQQKKQFDWKGNIQSLNSNGLHFLNIQYLQRYGKICVKKKIPVLI